MPQQTFDPGSKWSLEGRASAILWLARARGVISARAKKAEVVHPRKLPDGLVEAMFAGEPKPRLMLMEVATYPEPRVIEQMSDDLRLVRQARGVLADAVVLCMARKGAYRVPGRTEASSPLDWSGEALRWKVVELWDIPAADLLAAPDVGVVPWATLGKHEGPPEALLRRCRDRIDREGAGLRNGLLAVTQVFARLNYDRPHWMEILGGEKMMMDMPCWQKVVADTTRVALAKAAAEVLEGRFGPVPQDIKAGLASVNSEEALTRLTRLAGNCKGLPAYQAALAKELPKRPAASTRGRKRKA